MRRKSNKKDSKVAGEKKTKREVSEKNTLSLPNKTAFVSFNIWRSTAEGRPRGQVNNGISIPNCDNESQKRRHNK